MGEDLKVLTDLVLKLSPEHEDWIMKHWGYLYE